MSIFLPISITVLAITLYLTRFLPTNYADDWRKLATKWDVSASEWASVGDARRSSFCRAHAKHCREMADYFDRAFSQWWGWARLPRPKEPS